MDKNFWSTQNPDLAGIMIVIDQLQSDVTTLATTAVPHLPTMPLPAVPEFTIDLFADENPPPPLPKKPLTDDDTLEGSEVRASKK